MKRETAGFLINILAAIELIIVAYFNEIYSAPFNWSLEQVMVIVLFIIAIILTEIGWKLGKGVNTADKMNA